jgi:hypothetical protein
MPNKQNKNNFVAWDIRKFKMKEIIPYVIYADFETALLHVNESVSGEKNSYTIQKRFHAPSSFCYQVVSHNPEDSHEYKPFLYRGPDAVKRFWQQIKKECEKISEVYAKGKPLIITPQKRREMLNVPDPRCHICEEKILDRKEIVIDHDHVTSKIRGIAHTSCNLAYTVPNIVPVFFHNGSNYDFKLIVSELASVASKHDAKLRRGKASFRTNIWTNFPSIKKKSYQLKNVSSIVCQENISQMTSTSLLKKFGVL